MTKSKTARPARSERDLLILAAGAAVAGAVVGALLPRSAAEIRLLAPIGPRVATLAITLGSAVRQAISAQITAVPLVGPMASAQFEHVIDQVFEPA